MNIDELWAEFTQDRAFRKASIAEKLDTMAAQLQEIQTDTSNTAQVVPKILGDEGAIDTANEGAMPDMGMSAPQGGMDPSMAGGIPPEAEPMSPAGDMGGEDMATDEKDVLGASMDEGAPAPDMGMEGAPAPDVPPEPPMDLGAPDAGLGVPDEGLGAPDMTSGAEISPDLGAPDAGLGGDIGGGLGEAVGSGMTLDDVAIELIRSGKREEARVVLEAAAGNGSGPIESPEAPLGGGDIGNPVPPAPEAGSDTEVAVEEESEPAPDSEGGSESKDDSSKDDSKDDSKVKKSDESCSDASATFSASSDDLKEIIGKIMGDAVSAIMSALDHKNGVGGPDSGIEIEIETEGHEEKEEEDKNEEIADDPFEESCGCKKSAVEAPAPAPMSFSDYVELRRQGGAPIGDWYAKSHPEMNTSFQKSEGIFDDLTKVSEKPVAQKREEGVADELGETKSEGGSDADRGEILDDIDAKKPATTTSRTEGLLDENDSGTRSQATKSPQNDMTDDLDEQKSAEGTGARKEGLLEEVDEVKKSEDDLPGKPMMSFAELLALRKAERPSGQAGFDASRVRPDFNSIAKNDAPKEPIKLGHGVDPAKVVEADWAEYKRFMAQRRL